MSALARIPHSIAVIDVGSTNTKVVQFGPDFEVLNQRSTRAVRLDGPPYLHLDPETVLRFASRAIRDFDRITPVDAIVPCSHGSALALLDRSGDLALAIMSYLANVPDDIARAYARIEPPFPEVLAPTNPGALTLGRQLLWQETHFPRDFPRVRHILPYAQYIAFRLCGTLASEVTSLGAQTHLWAPRARDYSTLARSRGWADLMAPVRRADEVLGTAPQLRLQGQGKVLCGIHDSNANYLTYEALKPLVLLSTGTWIIAFDSAAELGEIDALRDQVSNTTVSGAPVGCARFMGGEEFGRVAGADNRTTPSLNTIAALIGRGTLALPSFTDSGGPVPNSGSRGRILGPAPETDQERAGLAALYTAQMTAVTVQGLGRTQRVVVDGPFAANDAYLSVLASLLPDREVYRSRVPVGSARGAALLALNGAGHGPETEAVAATVSVGLQAYNTQWLARASEQLP